MEAAPCVKGTGFNTHGCTIQTGARAGEGIPDVSKPGGAKIDSSDSDTVLPPDQIGMLAGFDAYVQAVELYSLLSKRSDYNVNLLPNFFAVSTLTCPPNRPHGMVMYDMPIPHLDHSSAHPSGHQNDPAPNSACLPAHVLRAAPMRPAVT